MDNRPRRRPLHRLNRIRRLLQARRAANRAIRANFNVGLQLADVVLAAQRLDQPGPLVPNAQNLRALEVLAQGAQIAFRAGYRLSTRLWERIRTSPLTTTAQLAMISYLAGSLLSGRDHYGLIPTTVDVVTRALAPAAHNMIALPINGAVGLAASLLETGFTPITREDSQAFASSLMAPFTSLANRLGPSRLTPLPANQTVQPRIREEIMTFDQPPLPLPAHQEVQIPRTNMSAPPSSGYFPGSGL